MTTPTKHTNRLFHETSPYLRQHAHNPVDWYPWGDEALERAQAERKPILLSIGYAACHWCHVMERESFENEAIAAQMNEHFVCIKVDREERPDLDAIYMHATQLMCGHGGWPMTVFLTPEGAPYYAGTYFPPTPGRGMPSFPDVLTAMADAWRKRPDDVATNARNMTAALKKMADMGTVEGELSLALIDDAARRLERRFDEHDGGFGGAPKFPQTMSLAMLLRHHRRTRDARSLEMVTLTLRKMARGGIYDQLGGGFARYSVDDRWLVPHFEKMLYDNALLAGLYLETWQVTHDDFFRTVAEGIVEYVLRDLADPIGGFYATEDADSEGVEGKFYVWTPAQIEAALGDERLARIACAYYDVTPLGNFEHGSSILNVPTDEHVVADRLSIPVAELREAIAVVREKLLAARAQRIRPMRDEKIIACWNGLMLDALCRVSAGFDRLDWLAAARRSGEFIMSRLWRDGRLHRVCTNDQTRLNGYLEDYAAVGNGLLSLYEVTGELTWLTHAREVVDRMIALFEDSETGGFFFTSHDHEALLTRFKDPYDNATPSGTSLAVMVLLRLGALLGQASYTNRAMRVLRLLRDPMAEAPSAFGMMLCALDLALERPFEIALLTVNPGDVEALRPEIFREFVPNKVVAVASLEDAETLRAVPLLAGKKTIGHDATAYVCRDFHCEMPVTTAGALRKALGIA